VAPQLAEQLLQVRQRNLLALADGSQRHRSIALAQPEVNHGCDRKTAFGCETHRKLLQFGCIVQKPPGILVGYPFQVFRKTGPQTVFSKLGVVVD
jgi:hypothetical protein